MTTARFPRFALMFLMLAAASFGRVRGEEPPQGGRPLYPEKKGWDCIYGSKRPTTEAEVRAANQAAIAENPENDVVRENGTARSAKGDAIEPTPLGSVDEKGIISTGRKWRPGRVIRISFLGGDPTVQQRVAQCAMEWTKHANIKFQFIGNGGQGEVRIAFQPGGSWSLLGTDALTAQPGQPTMNFGWLAPDSKDDVYTSVVLHEFGHMLALVHEHMFPGPNGIQWYRDRAIAYYGETQHWSPQQVQQQVLDVYNNPDAVTTTKPDLASIMMYPIPQGVANVVVGWNTRLSPTDIDFIGRHYYPPPGLKPTMLSLGTEPIYGAVRGTQVAAYRFRVDAAGTYLVRVTGPPVELLLLADGPRKLARGESAGQPAKVTIGADLEPGEYAVRLRRKDPNAAGSGNFQISVKKED